MTVMKQLRQLADSIDQAILNATFTYEQSIDGEWGCCHSAEEIEQGRHSKPEDDIEIVALLATKYGLITGGK